MDGDDTGPRGVPVLGPDQRVPERGPDRSVESPLPVLSGAGEVQPVKE